MVKEEVEELDEKSGQSHRGDKESQATDAAQQTLDFMKSGGKIQTIARKKKRKEISQRLYKGEEKEVIELMDQMNESQLITFIEQNLEELENLNSDTVSRYIGQVEEKLDVKKKTVDMLRGRVKVPASYDNEHKSAKVKLESEGKQPDQGNVPFTPDVKQPVNQDVVDKSGAKHSPMSRARHLARMAMNKLKKEM